MTIALPRAPRGVPVSPMVGAHPSMLHLREEIRHAARLAGPVLIEGPTGAGKELAAELLHVESGRAGPLVALNVTTLPEQLADAELFGTERGAYTGASERPGLLEEARGGTLYLDEAGDLAPALQAKLLRVIESGRIRAMLGEPSLAGDCVEYLMAYPWPGNVRELRRVVERAAFLARGRGIGRAELREALRQTAGSVSVPCQAARSAFRSGRCTTAFGSWASWRREAEGACAAPAVNSQICELRIYTSMKLHTPPRRRPR